MSDPTDQCTSCLASASERNPLAPPAGRDGLVLCRDCAGDQFLFGYIAAQLWASTDDWHGDQFDAGNMADKITGETRQAAYEDCATFLASPVADDGPTPFALLGAVVAATADDPNRWARYSWSDAGHDFSLTRNGHGTGYWDRPGLPDATITQLTEAAGAYGECLWLFSVDDDTITQL